MKPTQLLTVAQWCALPLAQATPGHEDRLALTKAVTQSITKRGKTSEVKNILKALGYSRVSDMDENPLDLRIYLRSITPLYRSLYPNNYLV